MKIRRVFKMLLYTLGIVGVGFVLYLIVTTRISESLYGYSSVIYNHEIDTLFKNCSMGKINIPYVYKSGRRGSVYYVSYNSTLNIIIIEANNLYGVSLQDIDIESVPEIKLTQAKTYSTIAYDPFPIVQQILNPEKSSYLKILIEEPYYTQDSIRSPNFFYLKGNYGFVGFSNTQNFSIVSFRKNTLSEMLILKSSGKIYFIMQTSEEVSLFNFINPSLLVADYL